MMATKMLTSSHVIKHIINHSLSDCDLFDIKPGTKIDYIFVNDQKIPRFTNEFWTSKQRQANSIHEISYRACFKAQLPHFFIDLLTKCDDIVYDPFNGRGTTIIEAALMGRNVITNDINPLSIILSKPRLSIPNISMLQERLNSIEINHDLNSDIDLSMFYHSKTLAEILTLKHYLINKNNKNAEDDIDMWIRMVATNRLTGHSKGFFSVYTLPPNQAISQEKQLKINIERKQIPEYKNTKEIILKKSNDLLKDITNEDTLQLKKICKKAVFLNKDSRHTCEIPSGSIQLTVTSPPFLDIVQYADDNWLRCWFNNIDINSISSKITMSKKLDDWKNVMSDVFKELYRITKDNGWVAFEVGEIRKGTIKLDEHVAEIALNNGFSCEGIIINEQIFTKTANIWGVDNNTKGTNTNRIVLLRKS